MHAMASGESSVDLSALSRKLRPCLLAFAVLAMLFLNQSARGALITFSEQIAEDEPMDPNPLTSAHGLPGSLTATFSAFNAYSGDPDHTPDNPDNKLVYGQSNSALTIIFNQPVEVPSFFVTIGPFGTADDVFTGSLAGQQQFTFTDNDRSRTSFNEVTAGAGTLIDTLTFTNFRDSELDDITVLTPEPVCVPLVLSCVLAGARWWRRGGSVRV